MRVEIEFACDNAAFEDAFPTEIRMLMEQAAGKIDQMVEQTPEGLCLPAGEESGAFLRDTNGNTCGKVTVKGYSNEES